jgi:hypothetical protein
MSNSHVIESQRVRAKRGPMTGSAKQSRMVRGDSWVAALLAMTRTGRAHAFPRHEMPELCIVVAPRNQGAGNAGCRNAPAALRASEESTQASHHRYAEQAGIPCAMVFGLWRALPGVPGLIAPVASPNVLAKLDLSVGRPGPHAFARPRAASLVSRSRPRPPQPASRFVTIGRNVPLDEAGWESKIISSDFQQ